MGSRHTSSCGRCLEVYENFQVDDATPRGVFFIKNDNRIHQYKCQIVPWKPKDYIIF